MHENLHRPKPRIAVAGTAEMNFLSHQAFEKAESIGREIIRQGGVIVSGATTGFPFWAAKGAKAEGGISVGLSPASSEREHVETYRLPLKYMDLIIYTGFGYPGRDLLMTRTADAVIIGAGRIGTLHEFTVAYEDQKPIGVITGDWEDTDEVIKHIMDKSHRPNNKVIFEDEPAKLVSRLMAMVKEEKALHDWVYVNDDNLGGKIGDQRR